MKFYVLQSFHFKEAYIQTQLPLPETVVDFWNMCSDYKCQFVAVLDENNVWIKNLQLTQKIHVPQLQYHKFKKSVPIYTVYSLSLITWDYICAGQSFVKSGMAI